MEEQYRDKGGRRKGVRMRISELSGKFEEGGKEVNSQTRGGEGGGVERNLERGRQSGERKESFEDKHTTGVSKNFKNLSNISNMKNKSSLSVSTNDKWS